MTDVVVRADGLGKRFRIGKAERYPTLRDKISALGSPDFWRSRRNDTDADTTIWALRDVGFEVRRGEVLGIIGRNGAGKSTLLKILSRITRPTTGFAEVRGRVASLLEVGTGFHPELSGRENVFLNGAILGMKKHEIRRKFDDIVAFAEVQRFIDTPVKRYSSGMYVRLAFAVAAHLEPDILIVDEVLAVGDVSFQRRCLGKMSDVARQGRTVLFVSHNLVAVTSMCSRAMSLEQGAVQFDGAPRDAVGYYTRGTFQTRGAVAWDPPVALGDGTCRLLSVAVHAEHRAPTEQIYTTDAISVVLEYEILQETAFIGATVVLHAENGTCVLSSLTPDGSILQRGTAQSRCSIPARLLNAELYRITVLLWGRRFRVHARVDDALVFRIADGGNSRGAYLGDFQGVVRPELSWETNAGEADSSIRCAVGTPDA